MRKLEALKIEKGPQKKKKNTKKIHILQVGKLIFLLVIFPLILFLFTLKMISRASGKAPLTFSNQSK
jgi:quinol-cytochrome oxidoreductase complex cytochrome b subunit